MQHVRRENRVAFYQNYSALEGFKWVSIYVNSWLSIIMFLMTDADETVTKLLIRLILHKHLR
jgi:hypothetical protein